MVKPWRLMTDKEISRLKATQCQHCVYFSKAGTSIISSGTCDYILMEGHSRGCLPTECITKGFFRKAKSSKRRVTLSI